jgi:hypothetical protein
LFASADRSREPKPKRALQEANPVACGLADGGAALPVAAETPAEFTIRTQSELQHEELDERTLATLREHRAELDRLVMTRDRWALDDLVSPACASAGPAS